jgi:hypothetical protein
VAAVVVAATVGVWAVGAGRTGGGREELPVLKDSRFDSSWHDGKAELAGYELTINRYGQTRKGTAVTIFVTEPFSLSAQVKADDGKHPASDVVNVMKLNLVQDFQTGIYPYHLMTSAFVAIQGAETGKVLKTTFSATEWCGQAWDQRNFRGDEVEHVSHSYFDGEEAKGKLEWKPGGLSEDGLMLWARGFAGPVVAAGETVEAPLLRSSRLVRLRHQPAVWERARLSRSAGTTQVKVPAGTFEVETLTAEVSGDEKLKRTWTYSVEKAWPNRLVAWSCSDGEKGEMTGSERLPYWSLHGEGDEGNLGKLGLKVRGERMP